MSLFILLRLWLKLLHEFGQEPAAIYSRGAFWTRTLGFLVHMTYQSPGSSVVAPALIWIAVTFRYSDWVNLMRKSDETEQESPAGE